MAKRQPLLALRFTASPERVLVTKRTRYKWTLRDAHGHDTVAPAKLIHQALAAGAAELVPPSWATLQWRST